MSRFVVFLLTSVLLSSTISVTSSEPTVNINAGKIIGQTVEFHGIQVDRFLSIPYAYPPKGKYRFKEPRPISFYNSTLRATRQPPACPQLTPNPYPWYYDGPEKSEDCLFLNIWVPSSCASNKKAVIYWIHGGGWRFGSIRQDIYDGVALAALGDVIVVTVNYRLGPFGFLYTGTKGAPGNAGLWDIALGLQWVNFYIGLFGGDTSRITIAGESAGSSIVGLLNALPLTKQLFRRMIMGSGSPQKKFDNGTRNLNLAQQFAAAAGCANESYTIADHPKKVTACLKRVDFNILMVADTYLMSNFPRDFSPQYGHDVLYPEDYPSTVSKENFQCPELLIGVNSDEGANIMSSSFKDIFGFFGEKDPHVNRSVAEMIIRNMSGSSLPDKGEAAAQYYLPKNLPDYMNIYRYQAYSAAGDILIICPTAYYAQKCAVHGQVYFYNFKHRPSSSVWAEWEGATHFDDVEFVFGRPLLRPEEYRPEEANLSRKMIKIWTDFAKFGSPGNSWPLYSESNPVMVNLDTGDTSSTEEGPNIENCRFVSKYLNYA